MAEGAELLADRYRLADKLGQGGMGVVYRGRDHRLDRDVAIKLLPPEQVGDSDARLRLIREAKAAARLQHPGIVQVFDVGESDEGGAYLVMELVEGRTLRQLLREAPDGLETDEAVRILSDVASTLTAAHRAGLVHRDVKPENVMLRSDGRTALLDFGLVKQLSRPLDDQELDDASISALTESGVFVGTPAYIAPEQARGSASPASDQWALAVMAIELLSGRRPWRGQQAAQMLVEIMIDEPRRLSELTPRHARAADAVIARALRKLPTERFNDCDAFVATLAGALDAPEPAEFVTQDARAGAQSPPRPVAARVVDDVDPHEDTVMAAQPHAGWRRWGLAAVLVAILVGVVARVWSLEDRTGLAAPEPPPATSPLLDPATVVACPLLEAEGVEAPTGWLGAAGAHAICEVLLWQRGGVFETNLAPAQLLDLPAAPTDDFPADPYVEPDAAERSLAAAQQRAGAWIEGTIVHRSGAFEIRARILSPAGAHAEGVGEGETVHQAARALVSAWVEQDALPRFDHDTPLTGEVAGWINSTTVEHAMAWLDILDASQTGEGLEAACLRAEQAGTWPLAGREPCRPWWTRAPPLPGLERASAQAMVRSVEARWSTHPAEDREQTLRLLLEAREEEDGELGRAMLGAAAAPLLTDLGRHAEAAQLSRAAIVAAPRWSSFRSRELRAIWGEAGTTASATAHAAWVLSPYSHSSLAGALGRLEGDTARAAELYRRAHVMAPAEEAITSAYAMTLLSLDRPERLRNLAAEADQTLLGGFLNALAEIGDSRFAAALARLRGLIERYEVFGYGGLQSVVLHVTLGVGEIIGPPHEVADELIAHLVPHAPRDIASGYYLTWRENLLLLGAHASSGAAREALRSPPPVRRLPGHQAYRAAVERLADGDVAGAARLWREALGQTTIPVPVEPFIETGQTDVLVHRVSTDFGIRYAGVSIRDRLELRRCAENHDHACVLRLAPRIVDRWSRADVEPRELSTIRAWLTAARDAQP